MSSDPCQFGLGLQASSCVVLVLRLRNVMAQVLVRQEAVAAAQPRSSKPFQVELLLRQGSSSMDLPHILRCRTGSACPCQ